jgi:O-antigen biosynthesis rhamnosyltransferase
MKVLHVYKAYLPDSVGGVEKVIEQIALSTKHLGVITEVLTLSSLISACQSTKVFGQNVYQCKTNFEFASTPFSLPAISKFKLLSKEADIIHYHFPYPFADLLHFLARVDKPSIVTYHSDIVKQKYLLKIYQPLMHRFLNSATRIVATSPNYLESSNILQRYKKKTDVIPIGLNKESYPVIDQGRLDYWTERYGESFFLYLGVLRYYKGVHVLIEAAINCDCPIIIAGDGPMKKELQEQVKKLNLENVHFVGFVSDENKVALIKLCYAIILPSHLRSEAFGISLLEGAMYGRPMISCEISTGTTYININNKTGLVVPPNDSIALNKAMVYLLDNSKIAKKMGMEAQERYQTYFTAIKMADSYVKTYEKLLKK